MQTLICHKAGVEPPPAILPAIYILSTIKRSEVDNCVSPGKVDFNTLEQLSRSWKPAERALLKLARELCGENERSADIEELFSDLDREGRVVALTALDLYVLIVPCKFLNKKQ